MGLRLNHNFAALKSIGYLETSRANLSKSIERLSSGLRINRSADDPTGLSISEKVRAQIQGLSRAITNAQDGVSIIQAAEGALSEGHSLLNRMRELTLQSQSDSLTSTDRLEIQREVDQLLAEIDRISSTTEFNSKKQLDGSMTAHTTSDHKDLRAYSVGGPVSAGEYELSVQKATNGKREIQSSAIQRDKDTDEIAGLDTQLKDLDSMYDSEGNFFLDTPKTLTLRAHGKSAEVLVTSTLTISEFGSKIESAIVNSKQLDLIGSNFGFDTSSGQFFYEAGVEGQHGELSFAGDENLLMAIAMQKTQDSEEPSYLVKATEMGTLDPITYSQNTTNGRVMGLIKGLELDFKLESEARIDGSVSAKKAITALASDIVFTFHDTNAKDNSQSSSSISAGVTVTLTNSRTYTITSIATMINNAIAAANSPSNALTGTKTSSSYSNPGLTASFSGYDLKLTSTITGTSGEISIVGNSAAQEILGIVSGKYSGSGGSYATITGTVDISAGATISGTGVTQIQIGDGDFNQGLATTATNITFNRGVALTSASIAQEFNDYFTANSIKITASITSAGKLELKSTETGNDAKISLTAIGGNSLTALGLSGSSSILGSGGSAAVFTGDTSTSQETVGFTLSRHLLFSLTDKSGNSSETIQFGTSNTLTSGESFTISKEAVVSILNSSSVSSSDVGYKVDSANRLDFFSNSTGKDSRVILSTNNNAVMNSAGYRAFGIDFDSAEQGDGESDFRIHVADRSQRLAVGSSRGQFLNIQIRDASTASLSIQGLDVSSINSATKSLGKIDEAIDSISSERARLGAIQNRLNSAVNNLTFNQTSLSLFESQIRDVDFARETTEFTRNQFLLQSGSAQLMQANLIPQSFLKLFE